MNAITSGQVSPDYFNFERQQLQADMFKENQLTSQFLGLLSLNSFARHNSPSRAVMFANHFSQRLVIKGANEQRVQTGTSQELSKYTFSVKMPENGRIIKVIDRYPKGMGRDAIGFNPETIVIFEREDTREIDYFSIPHYMSMHQFFGFKYDHKDEPMNMLKPGSYIPKDTIFADSPSVSENGGFQFGRSMNVAFMSDPAVSEDGMSISRDVLDDLKFNIYEHRSVEFGSTMFPLNMFGTKDHYVPFKDIGDYLDDSGVLMMLRTYDDDLAPVDTSIYDTMEPDFTFDRGVYVRGGKGRIVDIKVVANNSKSRNLPVEISEHINKYEKALLKFHQEIINTEETIRRERRRKFADGTVKLSPRFHRLLVESLAIVDYNAAKQKQNLNLLYRKAPIDEIRIEFVVEYEITPNIGFKLTDCHGGKGVICKIEEPENMPVDKDGNRADIIMDDGSTISRMNLGRLYEHYYSAAARDITKEVRRRLGITEPKISEYKLLSMDPQLVWDTYNFLLGFYEIVSERQYLMFKDELHEDEKLEHLMQVINSGVYIYNPIDTNKESPEVVKAIERYHRPTYGPITYVGNSGLRRTTKRNVRIAPLYMMLLEKIADDWSSVASGKLQHFGVLAPMTKSEKFAHPFRNSPVRTVGETEGRIFAGYCGRKAIAEMLDRSNSPTTQRNLYWNVMNADRPGNIDEAVNRDYVALGGNKPLQLVKHVMHCAGFRPVYEPEDA